MTGLADSNPSYGQEERCPTCGARPTDECLRPPPCPEDMKRPHRGLADSNPSNQLEACDCGSAQENHGWACRCDNPPSKRKKALADSNPGVTHCAVCGRPFPEPVSPERVREEWGDEASDDEIAYACTPCAEAEGLNGD